MLNNRHRLNFLRAVFYSLVLIVFISIWAPELNHYYVPNHSLRADYIEFLRQNPSLSVLDNITTSGMGTDERAENQYSLAHAEDVMVGKFSLPGYGRLAVGSVFSADDLEVGPPSFQLAYASLVFVDILLRAYEETKDIKYLVTSKDAIVAWAEYEKRAWIPRGFLWDDHAIAGRVTVLVKFWKHYRNSPVFDSSVGKLLAESVLRSGRLLIKKGHFTFNTNHGVMQNLALLQISVAFPNLPDGEEFKSVAMHRLSEQMAFYLNEEGVFLEHSAGYQDFGIKLMAKLFNYLNLLNIDLPEIWEIKYQKALVFLKNIQRSDGTLPMFGDTASGVVIINDRNPHHVATDDLSEKDGLFELKSNTYPIAGYSVWWSGNDACLNVENLSCKDRSQTLLSWSNFASAAHKHADELSLLFWSAGQTWWTNTGYWPYGEKRRDAALSWRGSNAPHYIGESGKSKRKSILSVDINIDNFKFVELIREENSGYKVYRQVMEVDENYWIVLDYVEDSHNRLTQHVWTTYPDIKVRSIDGANAYNLTAIENNKPALTARFFGSNDTQIDLVSASDDPFGGWIIIDNNIVATNSFIVTMAPNSWSGVSWTHSTKNSNQANSAQNPLDITWNARNNWKIRLLNGDVSTVLERQREVIQILRNNALEYVPLVNSSRPQIERAKKQLEDYFHETSLRYPKYQELTQYRIKMSKFSAILLLLNIVALFLLNILFHKSKQFYLLSIAAWMSYGIWLNFIYF